jgi:hypothetical protein
MAFWTSQGLQGLAQSESGGNASLIHYPSGYTSSGTRSSASGLYGYLDSTWRTYAPQAGVDVSQYPRAYMAPASVQTQVAAITPTSNWTCPGCNARADQLAMNSANVTGTPSGTIADGSSSANPGGVDPLTGDPLPGSAGGSGPGQGGTFGGEGAATTVVGVSKSFFGDLSAWFTDTIKSGENWFVRGGLILIGLIVIAAGLFKLMDPDLSSLKTIAKSAAIAA